MPFSKQRAIEINQEGRHTQPVERINEYKLNNRKRFEILQTNISRNRNMGL